MQDLKKNLLRYHQREQLQGEIDQADKMLQKAAPEDRGPIVASKERTRRQLENSSPVPLTGKEKDSLHNLEKKLRDRITQNMPTQEVMRKNPAGAVDWHRKWENVNKPLIRMWKNVKIQLNPDSQDRDLSNIERYRPSGVVDRLRTDAQIPGVMSYHDIPDEQWPFDEPENTAQKQAARVYETEHAESEVNAALNSMGDDSNPTQAETVKTEVDDPVKHAVLLQRLEKAREALAQKRAEQKALDAAMDSAEVSA